jgi:5'-nucleotidase
MRAHGDVVVIAPDSEYSGASAALGALHLIHPDVRRARIEGLDECWAVSVPPALCVTFARLGAFGGAFDLIVSGINPGANVGRSIYHSGTVGAVLTGRNAGISGVAVSQAVSGFGIDGQGWDDMLTGQLWETAAEVASTVVASLVADPPKRAVAINLNVPNKPTSELKGWRRATVGTIPPRTMASAVLEPKQGHDDAFHVRMTWGDPVPLPIETDGGAVEADEVALSFLGRITDDDGIDGEIVEAALESLLRR